MPVQVPERLLYEALKRGVAAHAEGRLDDAVREYTWALEHEPTSPEALRLLGLLLTEMGNHDDGIRFLRLAVKWQPDNPEIHCNLSAAYGWLGDKAQAMAHALLALSLAPDLAPARWNFALVSLRCGDWGRGFGAFEFGFLCGKRFARTPKGALWQGDAIPGQRLLVHWEQGLGDTIQFVRFLRKVKERSQAHIILEVQRPLLTLLVGTPGADEVRAFDPDDPYLERLDFDSKVSLMSVPYRLGVASDADIDCGFPYIQPPPSSLAASSRRRIGLCWAGNPDNKGDIFRTIRDAATVLRPLVDGVDAEWVNLQVGQCAEQSDRLGLLPGVLPGWDFAQTAALISGLDAVVSVDTAVAHLAGALGRPVHVMVARSADYRWEGVTRTVWYPSARLYRQEVLGEWAPVVQGVRDALRD